jgi:hypothetical protein
MSYPSTVGTEIAEPVAQVDLRRAGRVLAAILLPIGPALVAVLRFVLPYQTNDSSTEIVSKVAAHQTAQNAVVWLGFAAVLVLVPSVIFAARAAGRRSPRLAAAAVLLMVPGYDSLALLVADDAALLFGERHAVAPATLATMYENVHPVGVVAGVVFVAGHVLGTLLLGIALLRTRLVAVWAGAATVVSQPLHVVAAVIVGSHPLDLLAWGLNAAGFAAVAVAILRMPDDEWAPAPRSAWPA